MTIAVSATEVLPRSLAVSAAVVRLPPFAGVVHFPVARLLLPYAASPRIGHIDINASNPNVIVAFNPVTFILHDHGGGRIDNGRGRGCIDDRRRCVDNGRRLCIDYRCGLSINHGGGRVNDGRGRNNHRTRRHIYTANIRWSATVPSARINAQRQKVSVTVAESQPDADVVGFRRSCCQQGCHCGHTEERCSDCVTHLSAFLTPPGPFFCCRAFRVS